MAELLSAEPKLAGPQAVDAGYIWLLPLFVGSGCSALIYEIVWFQLLQLVVGASAISLAVLLTTFMGGMCAGSLLFPKLISRRFHPLRVYAILELAIGIYAIVLLKAMPAVERLYVDSLGHGSGNVWLRGLVAGACLLPPTVLMGATLPAIARWFENSREGTARIGFFYSANIAGAVLGCLAAAFFLLRLYDCVIATIVAVVINSLVALSGFIISYYLRYEACSESLERSIAEPRQPWTVAHWAIGLSGFAALGAEVVWTRELSLLLGASVYTFSLILAVFLIGLGLGSGWGAALARSCEQPAMRLAWCQLGAGLSAGWAAWMMACSLPYWPIDPSLSRSPWFGFQLDLVRVAWAVLPAAFFWGMSFPLALSVATRGRDPAKLVAGVYAANTLGAILGALALSWFVVPQLGLQHAQQLLVAVSLLAGLSLLIAQAKRSTATQKIALCLGMLAGIACLVAIPKVPPGLAAYGRYLVTWDDEPKYLYSGDGLSASIAVSEFEDGTRNFHVSGKVVASSEALDMRLQRMLGHLPALLCEQPTSVLVVGCGAGVTAGSFVAHPSVKRIVICEIEPLIPRAAGEYFAEFNHGVIQDPRVDIILDDARHFMLTTEEKFDIITSDPIHPWVKGAAALYSTEYFELCKSHLNPGGIATQWVPLYESSLPAVKSEIASFLAAFPQGSLWSNDDDGDGYDLVMLGRQGEAVIDLDAVQARLDRSDHRQVRESLEEVQLGSALAILKCYAGRKRDLSPWLADAALNTDRNLRLQYLAGWALNESQAADIRDSMKPFVAYPEDLFVGSPKELAALKFWLQKVQKDVP